MKSIIKIFRLLIDEKFDFFKNKTNRKKAIYAFIKYIIITIATTTICYYAFDRIKFYGIDFDYGTLGLIILATQIISFVMSLSGLMNTLYNSKDNELLMGMPVSHNQVFIAKLMVTYVSEFISNLMYFMPIFISFGIVTNVTNNYYFLLPLFLMFFPILPMALAAFISVPMNKLINFIKSKLFLCIASVLLLCGFGIYFYMEVIINLFGKVNLFGQQIQTLIKVNEWLDNFEKSNVLFVDIAKAMHGENTFVTLPVIIVMSSTLFYLSTLLVKPFYFKMITKNNETKLETVRLKTNTKKESALKSLIRKEFYTTFRTPGYLFQYFIYALLMPLIVFVYDKLLFSITVSSVGEIMIGGAHILVLSLLALLSCTISASAISREGGTYYLMKTTPVSFKKQVLAKILFNYIIVFLALFVTAITSLIFSNIKPFYIVISTLIVSLLSIGQICWNFDMDLRKPTLDWYDSGEITSINKNTVNSIILSLVVSVAFAYITFLFARIKIIWYVALTIALLFAIGRIKLLKVRVNYYFKHNEV